MSEDNWELISSNSASEESIKIINQHILNKVPFKLKYYTNQPGSLWIVWPDKRGMRIKLDDEDINEVYKFIEGWENRD